MHAPSVFEDFLEIFEDPEAKLSKVYIKSIKDILYGNLFLIPSRTGTSPGYRLNR